MADDETIVEDVVQPTGAALLRALVTHIRKELEKAEPIDLEFGVGHRHIDTSIEVAAVVRIQGTSFALNIEECETFIEADANKPDCDCQYCAAISLVSEQVSQCLAEIRATPAPIKMRLQ